MMRFDYDDNRLTTWLLAAAYVLTPLVLLTLGVWKLYELIEPYLKSVCQP
jgi:hypothetical protein